MTDHKQRYLGIDLGTSGIKLIAADPYGDCVRAKAGYPTEDPAGWFSALKAALQALEAQLPLSEICAVAVSSQVGTYLTDTGRIIPWYSGVGVEELAEIKGRCTAEEFEEELGMDHPELVSYPLPRLLHIKRMDPVCTEVIMPKEALLRELTGNTVTDVFSQRGLCHPEKGRYSEKLLSRFGIDLRLPTLRSPTDLAGTVTQAAADRYGLMAGTPVYLGCNDFFAGLLGMGIWEIGTVFELSGTSEHLGQISERRKTGRVVSGPYFQGNATYGGTKASGVSCDYAIRTFGIENLQETTMPLRQPIFLPYLRGERMPIYDENARGVFFGITDQTTADDMAYAVLEGVVFSLYHIGEALELGTPKAIITGGGSSSNRLMSRLKAELFQCPIVHIAEGDSSALGAAILAMVGIGAYTSIPEAIGQVVHYAWEDRPDGSCREILLKRYEIYRSLYISLKDQFSALAEI